jgi:hypothetical protein
LAGAMFATRRIDWYGGRGDSAAARADDTADEQAGDPVDDRDVEGAEEVGP